MPVIDIYEIPAFAGMSDGRSDFGLEKPNLITQKPTRPHNGNRGRKYANNRIFVHESRIWSIVIVTTPNGFMMGAMRNSDAMNTITAAGVRL